MPRGRYDAAAMSAPRTEESASVKPSHPDLLAAFLRSVERRAALFAELQCGDAEQGDLVVATTIRSFHQEAVQIPVVDWPRRFWQRLAMSPALRPTTASRWAPPVMHLATLAAEDRQALLSRLAAGLPEDEATEVLCTDLVRYRAALAAACPRTPAGKPDADGWRALAEAIQSRMRELPEARMQRLARLRERALAPERSAASPPSRSGRATPSTSRAPRWRGWAIVTVVMLAALVLAATWMWPAGGVRETALDPDGTPGLSEPVIVTEPLAEASEPAQRVTPEEALANHPDLDLLRDPEALTVAQDAALHAWYLAGAQPRVPGDAVDPAAMDASVPTEEGRDATF